MNPNDSVGPYQLVHKKNDPMQGEVWILGSWIIDGAGDE